MSQFVASKIISRRALLRQSLILAPSLLAAPHAHAYYNMFGFMKKKAKVPVLVINSSASASGTMTTSAVNTVSSTLLIVHQTQYSGAASASLTDSLGNTWVSLSTNSLSIAYSRLYYCINPVVGTNHTFTSSNGANTYGTLQVIAWKGGNFALDSQGGTTGASGTSIQSGILSSSTSNSLMLSAICISDGTTSTVSVDSGFTISDQTQFNFGSNEGGALAYRIQATAASLNPLFSWTGSCQSAVSSAVFRIT